MRERNKTRERTQEKEKERNNHKSKQITRLQHDDSKMTKRNEKATKQDIGFHSRSSASRTRRCSWIELSDPMQNQARELNTLETRNRIAQDDATPPPVLFRRVVPSVCQRRVVV